MFFASKPRRARRSVAPTVDGLETRKFLSTVAVGGAGVSADTLMIKHGWHDPLNPDAVLVQGGHLGVTAMLKGGHGPGMGGT